MNNMLPGSPVGAGALASTGSPPITSSLSGAGAAPMIGPEMGRDGDDVGVLRRAHQFR